MFRMEALRIYKTRDNGFTAWKIEISLGVKSRFFKRFFAKNLGALGRYLVLKLIKNYALKVNSLSKLR